MRMTLLYEFIWQQIQVLQEQVNHLSEGQISNEDKYTRVKQENANLLTK